MFDSEHSWFVDVRGLQTDELDNEREIMEKIGIMSRFPQRSPLFCTGTRNGVRIEGNGRSEISDV